MARRRAVVIYEIAPNIEDELKVKLATTDCCLCETLYVRHSTVLLHFALSALLPTASAILLVPEASQTAQCTLTSTVLWLQGICLTHNPAKYHEPMKDYPQRYK